MGLGAKVAARDRNQALLGSGSMPGDRRRDDVGRRVETGSGVRRGGESSAVSRGNSR